MKFPPSNQQGVIGILGVLLYSSLILIVGGTMVTTSLANYRISGKRITSTQTFYHAESGAEDALMQMRRDPNFGLSPTTVSTSLGTNSSVDTLVEPGTQADCDNSRKVTAAGYVGALVRKIQLQNCIVESEVNVQFNYAVQVDLGGVSMSNNSIVNGSVYSNGSVQGGSGARITSDATVAGGAAADPNPLFDPGSVGDYTFGDTSARPDAAQSFTATDSQNLIKVSLKIKKVGTPANATVRIVADSSGKPGTTTLASGILKAASVGTAYGFVDVSMTTNPALTNGTKYWVVVDGSSNASNYWKWASSNTYANQEAKYSANFSGGTWTAAGTDLAFKVWTGGIPTTLSGLTVGGNAKANTISSVSVGRDAYYQTISGSSVAGTSHPGSADQPTKDLPISDGNVDDFRDQCASGGDWTGDYTVSGTSTLGPKHITGNLNVSLNATLYLSGPLCVDGTANFSNNATIRMTSAYGGNESTFILSDGLMTMSNNAQIIGNGSSSFVMLIAEGTAGMNVANNGASAILVTRHGPISFSNNAGAKAMAVYRLVMGNNATITYTSGLADVNFTGGPGAKWTPQGWKEVVLN